MKISTRQRIEFSTPIINFDGPEVHEKNLQQAGSTFAYAGNSRGSVYEIDQLLSLNGRLLHTPYLGDMFLAGKLFSLRIYPVSGEGLHAV
jgi:hypothetical protein